MATKLIIKNGKTQPNTDNLDVNELGIYNKKLYSKTEDNTIYYFGQEKVDKVSGKGLSTNDYTTEEKQKLAGLKNYSLPLASSSARGGIKIGSEFTLNSEALTVNKINWSKLSNTPNTLSGYGITNDVIESSDVVQGIEDTTTKDSSPVSQAAVKTYITTKINESISANEAMTFKGTLGTGGTITQLPASGYKIGWSYKVITAGTYAGNKCEVGDLIIAIKSGPLSGTNIVNGDWTVVQSNIDGAITSSTSLIANQLVLGNGHSISTLAAGSDGRVLKMVSGKPAWSTDNNTNTTYTFADGTDGSFTVTPSDGSAKKISIGTPAVANALNLSEDIGSNVQPVYFDVSGIPSPISYTIRSNVPANAKFTDTTYSNFSRSADGLVPHPTTTTSTRFLREDGTWVVPTNTTYTLATTSKNGLLKQLSGNTSQFLRGDGTWAEPLSVKKYVATNVALTASSGIFTWNITAATHGISSYPIVQIFEVSTGEMVLADVIVNNSYQVTIKIVGTGTLAAGTYRVIIIG